MLSTYGIYYFIGYLLNTDILNAITPHKNGFSVSFVGIFLLIGTSCFLVYVIENYWKNKKIS